MDTPREEQQKNDSHHDNLQKENLTLLLDTLEGINTSNEFKTVLFQSMEATRLVMRSEASSLLLVDEENEELFISVPTGPAKNEVVGKSIPKNKGIAGWVLENKKPYLTNDVSKSDYFYGDLAKNFTTKNLIGVPLINKSNEVIGVIEALNKRNGEEYKSTDIPVFQALAAHITIAMERTKKIDRLHDQLKEKDVLIAEIHHRIKNNLQVLYDQIHQEIDAVEDQKSKSVLKNVSMRVNSMAKLHEMLCERNLNRKIDLRSYIKELVERIEETMKFFIHDVEISVSDSQIMLQQDKALLSGLILNELLVNIYKHAFTDEDAKKGNIKVNLAYDEGLVILSVSDNGIGFPEDFNIQAKSSIGMWIVHELLKKLDAKMSVLNDPGARFVVSFPTTSM